ncbi:MAG: hypothetical protein ABI673_04435 [Novosphingobium sp.]
MFDSACIERANRCIDKLQALITDFNIQPPRANGNPKATELTQQNIADRIAITQAIGEAVAVIFDILTQTRGGIHTRIPGRPPKWWGDFKDRLGHDRLKDTETHKAFLNTIDILDPYIRDDTCSIFNIAFIAHDTNSHIKWNRIRVGFRPMDKPYPDDVSIIFDPKIDTYISDTLHELGAEAPVFPKGCAVFLRSVLNEIRSLDT